VQNIQEVKSGIWPALRIDGMYVNMGFVRSYALGIMEQVYIKKKDINDWLICTEPKECLRDASWY
jgi:hypothetical protein